MGEIRSSQAVAQNIATKLDQSLQSIHQHQINYAEQTTVGGNRDAKETIQAEELIIHNFVAALQRDIDKIRKASSEFDKADRAVGNSNHPIK